MLEKNFNHGGNFFLSIFFHNSSENLQARPKITCWWSNNFWVFLADTSLCRPRHCQMTIRHQNKLPEFSDVLFWWTDHSVCYQFPFWPCMFVYLQIDLLWFKYPENNRSNLIKLADTWRKSLIKRFFLKKYR